MTTKNSVTAEELLKLISVIVLARHGNAPKVEGVPDSKKPLSAKGQAQAVSLGQKLPTSFHAVYSSPFTRAVLTAEFALGERNRIVEMPILAPTSDDMNTMFTDLMYSSLAKYFAHELGHTLHAWAKEALNELVEQWRQVHAEMGGRVTILVTGHAVCQNAIAHAIAELLGVDHPLYASLMELSLQTVLGEAEAISISLDEMTCELLQPAEAAVQSV
jgi:broad specificity phosphatase PhoE